MPDRRKDPREPVTLDELFPEPPEVPLELGDASLDLGAEAPGLLLANAVHLLANLNVAHLAREELDGALEEEALEGAARREDGVDEDRAEVGAEGEAVALAREGRHVGHVEVWAEGLAKVVCRGGGGVSGGRRDGTDFGCSSVLCGRGLDVLFDALYPELIARGQLPWPN